MTENRKPKRLAALASKMPLEEFRLPGDGRKWRVLAKHTKALFMECLRAGDDYTGANITLGLKHFAEFVGSHDSAERYLERLRRLMLVWQERDAAGGRTKKWKNGTIVRQASLAFTDISVRVRNILTGDPAASCVEGDTEFEAVIAMLSTPQIREVNSADSGVEYADSEVEYADSQGQVRRLEQSTTHHDALQPPVFEPPVLNHQPSNLDGLVGRMAGTFGKARPEVGSVPTKPGLDVVGRLVEQNGAPLVERAWNHWLRPNGRDFTDLKKMGAVWGLFEREFDSLIGSLAGLDVNVNYVVSAEVINEERARILADAGMTEEEYAREVEGKVDS